MTRTEFLQVLRHETARHRVQWTIEPGRDDYGSIRADVPDRDGTPCTVCPITFVDWIRDDNDFERPMKTHDYPDAADALTLDADLACEIARSADGDFDADDFGEGGTPATRDALEQACFGKRGAA